MKASAQQVANDPPTYSVRLHQDDNGDPFFLDDYVGLAIVVRRGDLGVVHGFCVPDHYEGAAREAIRVALRGVGIERVRASRVKTVSTQKSDGRDRDSRL